MSIPFFGLVAIVICEKIFKRKIFSPCDWNVMWIFGTIASLVLYPSALGLTHIDTYTWGWASSSLNGVVAAVALSALFLLWKKNRFGIVLLLALTAFACSLKISTNFWDYLIDPVYAVISIVMLSHFLYRSIKRS